MVYHRLASLRPLSLPSAKRALIVFSCTPKSGARFLPRTIAPTILRSIGTYTTSTLRMFSASSPPRACSSAAHTASQTPRLDHGNHGSSGVSETAPTVSPVLKKSVRPPSCEATNAIAPGTSSQKRTADR